MDNNYKIEPFIELAHRLSKPLPQETVLRACSENQWFTPEDIRYAVDVLIDTLLNRPSIEQWIGSVCAPITSKDVMVVMAGNIPLAGFYDMMCVLISGHRCHIKASTKDSTLIEFVVQNLLEIDAQIPVHFANENTRCDALIFSGSDVAAQVYKNLYPQSPAIMRTSRFSIAVLDGSETEAQLRALSDDVFRYFGLGCRNVSMIFVPHDFDISRLCILSKEALKTHRGFSNNYRAARALNMMNNADFIDLKTFMLKEGDAPSNHICELVYSCYESETQLKGWLAKHESKLQCVVSTTMIFDRWARFGYAQKPQATDFADGVDVLEFLRDI